MPGFPLRHLLQSWGSRLRNVRPIEHPELEVSAERLNRTERVAAAANLLMPRVSLVAEWDDTAGEFVILHQEEGWNVDHAQAHPVLTRGGEGQYSYTFAESYLDGDGVAVPFSIIAARCFAMRTTNSGGSAHWYPVGIEYSVTRGNNLICDIFVRDETQTFVDQRIWLEVL